MPRRKKTLRWAPPTTSRATTLPRMSPCAHGGGWHGQADQVLCGPRLWAPPDEEFARRHKSGACPCGSARGGLDSDHGQGPPRTHHYLSQSFVPDGPCPRHPYVTNGQPSLQIRRHARDPPGKHRDTWALRRAAPRTKSAAGVPVCVKAAAELTNVADSQEKYTGVAGQPRPSMTALSGLKPWENVCR